MVGFESLMAARQRQILRQFPVKFHLYSKVNFKLALDLFQRSQLDYALVHENRQ